MMTTIKTMKKLCMSLICLAVMAASSQADLIWTGTTGSDFGTATNWGAGSNPGTTPGNPETDVRINNGGTVDLTTNYPTPTNAYQLRVQGNSTLNASAVFTSTHLQIDNGSTVNLTGGAYTLPKTSANNNGVGALGVPSVSGTLNISGGTHVFNERLNGGSSGLIQVIGNDASISFHQIGGYIGTFGFQFDSDGVSTITGAGQFPWFTLSTTSLEVDGSALVGAGTFTLFDFTDAAGSFFTTTNVNVTGLGAEGTGWTLQQYDSNGGTTGGRNLVELTVVPEPTTIAMFGLTMAGLGFRRRR